MLPLHRALLMVVLIAFIGLYRLRRRRAQPSSPTQAAAATVPRP